MPAQKASLTTAMFKIYDPALSAQETAFETA
jgi:hypothetical protein